MQARSGDFVTAASHGDAVDILEFENGRCGDLAVRGDAVHQVRHCITIRVPRYVCFHRKVP